jgi:ribosomal protein L11 methyltransferase
LKPGIDLIYQAETVFPSLEKILVMFATTMTPKPMRFILYCLVLALYSLQSQYILAFHPMNNIRGIPTSISYNGITSFVGGKRIALYSNPGNDNDLVATTPQDEPEAVEILDAASLRSVTFSNILKDQEPQLLSNFLMELGACSTSIVDADRGTNDEQAIFDEFDEASMTRTAVTTHNWNNCHVSAHFAASTSLDWIMEIVQDSFPNLPRYDNVTKVEDKDWVLHVQKSWKPIVLPPFILRFPWHTDELVKEALAEKKAHADNGENDDGVGMVMDMEDAVQLELQGGIAFGTGEHPTTQLCLEFIQKVVRKPDMLIMDYGAGSGVLGMAACKLEPTARAIGVDIDVDAVHIANANAAINQVDMKNYLSDLVQTVSDDESTSIRLKAFSSMDGQQAESLPKELNGPIYDAVAANILAGPLVSLAQSISGLLKPGAPLGLSGIMTSQSSMVEAAYAEYFDDVRVEKELLGWVLITGKRKRE